ncbi:UNVERIFIED_CONTAM: protein COP1 SUPPRESSOR 2 [Sesamum latifolium]|uniref:Protein COP1 SUPPRESSOR 2 n=1 Tax=Sesamum latifolium TaxID=2727402 RepID=A0AAW2Y8Y1_9LAMI
MKAKNFRKRSVEAEDEDEDHERRSALALEEVKFLQRQREKKLGIPALITSASSASAGAGVTHGSTGGLARNVNDKSEGDVEKDDLVLQDTFAQETAVMVEDPNMLRYVEQELAKKKGKNIDVENQVESDVKRAEDELYKIPEHLKVKRRSSQENSTQWTTGIAEVQLPIEYKLKNIEETEAAKKLLQEKRFVGRAKAESSIPSSFSADFFQHGKDYAEKHRKGEHPQLYKDKGADGPESRHADSVPDAASRRQAATDEFMLERFRKRDRQRLVRR